MLVDETDAQAPERELVHAVHDVASDMSDVKNELAHVREMVGVLVRRERSAEHKAGVATRRLDRMEREQTEADDAEHEANLQEALANQSKAVKVVVDKWFVDKGYGFGKAPTGEIVFIHARTISVFFPEDVFSQKKSNRRFFLRKSDIFVPCEWTFERLQEAYGKVAVEDVCRLSSAQESFQERALAF